MKTIAKSLIIAAALIVVSDRNVAFAGPPAVDPAILGGTLLNNQRIADRIRHEDDTPSQSVATPTPISAAAQQEQSKESDAVPIAVWFILTLGIGGLVLWGIHANEP